MQFLSKVRNWRYQITYDNLHVCIITSDYLVGGAEQKKGFEICLS